MLIFVYLFKEYNYILKKEIKICLKLSWVVADFEMSIMYMYVG